jgi:hypothetical protein
MVSLFLGGRRFSPRGDNLPGAAAVAWNLPHRAHRCLCYPGTTSVHGCAPILSTCGARKGSDAETTPQHHARCDGKILRRPSVTLPGFGRGASASQGTYVRNVPVDPITESATTWMTLPPRLDTGRTRRCTTRRAMPTELPWAGRNTRIDRPPGRFVRYAAGKRGVCRSARCLGQFSWPE